MVTGIANIILGILGIIAFLWMMVGGLIGAVWIVVYLANDKKQKLNVKKWIVVTFGGIILLPIVFALYSLLFVGQVMTGKDDLTGVQLKPATFDAKQFGDVCRVDKMCGDVVGVNCNQEADGPYYYVNKNTNEKLATCGGACMGGGADCKTKCVEYGNLCK